MCINEKWVLRVKRVSHVNDSDDIYNVITLSAHPVELDLMPCRRYAALESDNAGYAQLLMLNTLQAELEEIERAYTFVYSTEREEGKEEFFDTISGFGEERRDRAIFRRASATLEEIQCRVPAELRPGFSFFAPESGRSALIAALVEAYAEEAVDRAKAVEAGC